MTPPGLLLGDDEPTSEAFTLPAEGFVRLDTILRVIPIGRSTWWAGVKNGRFPRPVKLGGVTMWKVSDIRSLIDDIERSST